MIIFGMIILFGTINHKTMKLLLLLISLLVFTNMFAQVEYFYNGEGYGSIRSKLNKNADETNSNTANVATNSALISSNSDSIDATGLRVIAISDSLATYIDTVTIGGGSEGGVTLDSLFALAQNSMYVPLDWSEPDTIYTNVNKDYFYEISANDTIVIVDDLDSLYYAGATTSSFSRIFVQNTDNTSEFFIKHNGTLISPNGIYAATKNNVLNLDRRPYAGQGIGEVLSASWGYTTEKRSEPSAPTISNATIGSDNAYMTIVFDNDVFGANDGTTPVNLSDFSGTFAQNGGTATACTFDSITLPDTTAITAGTDTILAWLTLTGTADGNETYTIKPVDGASIYESTGLAMDAGESVVDNFNVVFAGGTFFTISTSNNIIDLGDSLQATGADAYDVNQAIYNEQLTEGDIVAFYVNQGNQPRILQATTSSTIEPYAASPYGLFVDNAASYNLQSIRSGTITDTGYDIIANQDLVGFRKVSNNLEIVYSTDDGQTWNSAWDFSISDASNFYIISNINPALNPYIGKPIKF